MKRSSRKYGKWLALGGLLSVLIAPVGIIVSCPIPTGGNLECSHRQHPLYNVH